MRVPLFLLISLFPVGIPAVLSVTLDDKGQALFTGITLEITDGYAIPDQVSDLYLRIVLPFDEKSSSGTSANATDLWRAKAWGSTLKQGGGEKVDFEKQILSDAQTATPLDMSTNPMVIDEVVYSLDLVGMDCSVATFICVRFQAWENGPDVLFEYENGKKIARATECVPVNCTEETKLLDCGEHKDGDRWVIDRTDRTCLMESCVSGEIVISIMVCEMPECDTPRYSANSCCPICPGTAILPTALPEAEVTELMDVEFTTWVDDVELITLVDAEIIELVDAELVTQADVEQAITVMGDLTTAPEYIVGKVIEVDECEGHIEFETWEPQPCERCTCLEGDVVCSSPSCVDGCDDPIPGEGACCPVCPERECIEGAEWSPDACTLCTCIEGSPVCGEESCPETGCLQPKTVEGECCKQCLSSLRARPMNIRGEVIPRVWRAGRTMNPRFSFEVRTFPTSENVTGSGLWKLSMWVDSMMDGTGDRMFFKEQVLSTQQAAHPLYASQSINFSNVKLPVGGPGIDCPETVHFYCFEFQMGDDPSVSFRFLAPRQQSSLLRCIRAPCVS